MATKDLGSGDIAKQGDLDEMITCCICTEVYNDPKVLPCIHTFCMKCIQETGLKTNKGPGDEMPCPICRRPFKIPQEGFPGLPKHFFIEKLIQLANVSDQSASSRALCDVCVEENKEDGREIRAADTFCVDCKQRYCAECSKQHRKFKLNQNHKLIEINEHDSGQNLMTDSATNVCESHGQTVLDVYCADCKAVVCAICFIDNHNGHKGCHVCKFRKQIESNIQALKECGSAAQMKQAEFLEVKEDIQERVTKVECDIANRKEILKQLIDKHEASLLQSLCSTRQIKLKEIQRATDDIDTYLSCLETYNSYSRKIMAKGSASDICRAFSDLCARGVELQQQCQSMIEREIQSINFRLKKSEVDASVEESCVNVIGEIEEEIDLKKQERSTKSQFAEQKNREKILSLEEFLKQEQHEKEQLMIVQAKEKQRLLAELRYKSGPVLVETIITKASKKKSGWFGTAEESKDIHGLTILDRELFVVSEKSSEVEVYDSTKFSFSRQWNLRELIDPTDIASCNRNKCLYICTCNDSNRSTEILRVDPNGKLIKKWSTGDYWGWGLSVTDESNVILTVFMKHKLNEYSPDGQLIREINLSPDTGIHYLYHAIKLTNGHFTVCHGIGYGNVCTVDADGKLKKSFGGRSGSTDGQMYSPVFLSVDGNGFVMVADQKKNRVLLLDLDLKFQREILTEAKHGLRNPYRIHLDESNGRLFVADNKSDNKRILIFDFK